MRRPVRSRLLLPVLVVTALVDIAIAGTSLPALAGPAAAPATAATAVQACGPVPVGWARCFAEVAPAPTAAEKAAQAKGGPRPVTPADLQAAYHLPTGRAGTLVAIVDAYDNPRAESDLAIWRARYGLPPCTTKNGCFRKVNQRGKPAPLPPGDPGWGLEIALDLDAVSATCPHCSILLVEGDSSSIDSLSAAERTAVALGASIVSNSYGANEFPDMDAVAPSYQFPGVSIIASTGDDGFKAPSFPAVLATTVAVGGTTLVPAPGTTRGWKERAWSGAGSGCSAYIPKPVWQKDTHCLYRTTGDVSADADLASGLLVQDSYGQAGEVVVGGTSLAAPLIAGMMALSTSPRTNDASWIYAHRGAFTDVVGGSNGFCGRDYLCTGVTGYDGPTGVGTPWGVGGL